MKESFKFVGTGKSLVRISILKHTQRKGCEDKIKVFCRNYDGETFINCIITPWECVLLSTGLLKANLDYEKKKNGLK